jgi:hypothetical protein
LKTAVKSCGLVMILILNVVSGREAPRLFF